MRESYSMEEKLRDSIFGCLYGGAIGDAFGGQYEGMSSPISLDKTAPWRLSDDTQLTLATCEAIVETGAVDPAAIASQMVRWFVQGRLSGLGASTYKALTELSHRGHWALVGRRGEMAAGNGAAMRIAPLAFLLDPADTAARQVIHDVCRITHHSEEAYVGALAILLTVRMGLECTWTGEENLIEMIATYLPDSRTRDRLNDISQAGARYSILELAAAHGNSGYVVESVPLAIFGASQVRSLGFAGMLEQLISAGGDTDTIASMAGQISGTLLGYSSLPDELLSQLPEIEMIDEVVQEFCNVFASS